MRRLSTRLVLGHVAVAVVGAVVTVVLARVLAPGLYDRSMMMGAMMGGGESRRTLLGVVTDAVTYGVAAGLAVGVLVATWMSRRILSTLASLSAGVHRIAEGRYDEPVPVPVEGELAALAGDVNTLAAELGGTERRRLELLGEVAHEMRTPLSVLDGYVEGLQDGVFPPTPELLMELAGELHRLRRLSEDLSALSRAEEGRLDLEPQLLDLGALVAAGAERLRPQLEDAGLRLEVSADGTVPVVGDAVRLGQLLTNLMGNALVATAPGGRVVVGCAVRNGRAEVTVTDTGVGIATEDLERVFERFYRARGAARGTGSGIGLTIAAAIAHAHDGTLAAASPGPGRGSTFTLRLPTAAQGRAGAITDVTGPAR